MTWQDDSNTAVNLTGATVTVRFRGSAAGSVAFPGTGTLTVTTPASGILTYAFSAADVATAGSYALQFKAVFAGGTILHSDQIWLDIAAAI